MTFIVDPANHKLPLHMQQNLFIPYKMLTKKSKTSTDVLGEFRKANNADALEKYCRLFKRKRS